MSKLVLAVVHRGDADVVAEGLRSAGHRFTRLVSVGGFLGETNTTFMLATAEDALDALLEVFAETTGARELELPLVLLERLDDWRESTVRHGGATILIVDLERIVKL
jgi:uncharacterized protein YaaQ